ncbi:MAG: TonB-dependent receptor [Sphingomonas bacterium]|nr:TonB-dependent receptor [Sphingomonas bacterium]
MDYAPPVELRANQPAIVVTASRLPGPIEDSAASVSIVDDALLDHLGESAITAYLRLLPSTSISTSGPSGSFTQVRIRGAEANHSLLFIDGIRANDPAAGNEPRFELLNADIASRVELVRGPQSALWGSEAVGGVIAVGGDAAASTGASGTIEAGSLGFRRASGSASYDGGALGIALAFGHQSSDGIDSFDGDGERDGFTSNALRGLARWSPVEKLALTASGFWLAGRSDYDGTDPFTYLRADTLDRTRNRLAAGRVGLAYGETTDAWQAKLSGSVLRSRNRNLLDGSEINESEGRRSTVDAEVDHLFTKGSVEHSLIVAGMVENERFSTADIAFGGFSNQSRDRRHWSLTGEWRASFGDRVITDVAVRRDAFNRFRDATTVRASVLFKASEAVSLTASYGEGIAQPTFFDLFGFFPGSFVGNPSLKNETSGGLEGSIRYRKNGLGASLTAYAQRLRDEIIGTYDRNTFLSSAANAAGKSRRQGIEAEASWSPSKALRLAATYSFLDASEPSFGKGRIRELRRPKHSGSVTIDGSTGKFTYGGSIAYVGRRADTDFDLFERVSLSPYWLAGARVAYALRPGVELFGRIANAFDDRYQDVVGYRTEGRSAYAGLRLAVDR